MNRKQRRAARKKLPRKARHQAQRLSDSLSRMPSHCDECQKSFDNRDGVMLDSWKIAVYDDGPIHLVCPECVAPDTRAFPAFNKKQ